MSRVICTLTNQPISKITASLFFKIEKHIIDSGFGEDKDSFEAIKKRLLKPPVLKAEEFAEECIYVILAGGFRQKVAKKKFGEIMNYINCGGSVCEKNLLPIFGNVNKIKAIVKIWNNSKSFRDEFYTLKTESEKLSYLGTLPHIGEITKNHLARNLGISNVKYDVWIQRLGIALGKSNLQAGFPLSKEVKVLCDKMFAQIEKATGLNKGYIDVVLWKACQERILSINPHTRA
ncbi:MAG: hypothetical protein LBC85_00795 [Fibromonadaceae bacterium]|jgi:hypothetical protein|nr:hypothetical protein [Fibromonadaceae bacterium]